MNKFVVLLMVLLGCGIVIYVVVGNLAGMEDDVEEDTMLSKDIVVDKSEKPVGEAVDFSGLELMVNRAWVTAGGEEDNSSTGQFLVVNMGAENKTEKDIKVEALLDVIVEDSKGNELQQTVLYGSTKPELNDVVKPGGVIRGEMVYEAPLDGAYSVRYLKAEDGNKNFIRIYDYDLISTVQVNGENPE